MNSIYEQKLNYHLLKILGQNPNLNQREMAGKIGLKLGKVNYCLTELAQKGFIRINRFKIAKNKRAYSYFLTLKGLEEKSRLTISFLKRKISEYEKVKQQINELTREVKQNGHYGLRGKE